MRLTVLGGCGAWPEAGQACSGYLVEHDGFRLVVDLGYATFPRLLEHTAAADIDAVLISHGHPDHCADLNPLLRARALADDPVAALPVYALRGALDAVLALDRPGMYTDAIDQQVIRPEEMLQIGPFRVATRLLPHWLPNVGIRLEAAGSALAYTGDSGSVPQIAELATDASLLLAEATYLEQVPEDSARFLSSATAAGRWAEQAGVGQLVLTHLWPGSDKNAAAAIARQSYAGEVAVATAGMEIELS
ncbi:MAG TPA: MBL fold metallo-hydrolase [Streptosporangiaceae bacterium]|nr:MBL fold metallo-hydrolase [Streptosporangiaceae bacterium]